MLADLPLQQLNELWLHELEAVGDVQAHELFPSQGGCELLLESHPVLPLHHEDQVRPFKLFGTQQAVRVWREASGVGLDAGRNEYLLRGGAAKPVSAADEEHTSQRSDLSMEAMIFSSRRSTQCGHCRAIVDRHGLHPDDFTGVMFSNGAQGILHVTPIQLMGKARQAAARECIKVLF